MKDYNSNNDPRDLSPIRLEIPDYELGKFVYDRIAQAQNEWAKFDLRERQEKLEAYLFGDQLPKNLRSYQMPYKENILWETHVRNKAIAVSRIPDIIIKPGNVQANPENAKALTRLIERDFSKRERKNILGKAYVQRPASFYAVIKARWNPELGANGNYEFVNVSPKNILLDPFVETPNADKMSFLAEKKKLSVHKLIMMFPKKKTQILEELGFVEGGDTKKEDFYQNLVDCQEVWFDYYKEVEDEQFEKISGVLWMLDSLVLEKIKNPYFDFEGEPHYFKYDHLGKKKEISDVEFFEKMFGGNDQNLVRNKEFQNFFKDPRKPYFIMTYQNWDKPVDETTNYEQVLELQDNINIEGRQIHEMNARSRGKHVFNTQAIKKETIESTDYNDPDQAIVVDGNIRDVYSYISSPPAPSQLYSAKNIDRSIAFEMLALNATTRGTREAGDETLGARQMMREQDFGVIDDMVDDTINQASEWMAEWTLQFIKLFYKKPHMVRVLGEEGNDLYINIVNDYVEDGMEIEVGASSVDKMQKRREAYERARMGMTDPLTFFEDTEVTKPEERTLRLMLFQSSPELYIQKYLQKRDTKGMAQELIRRNRQLENTNQNPQGPPMGGGMPNNNRVMAHKDKPQNKSWFNNFRHLDKNDTI
jgi:hypothetical protein